MNIIKVVIEVPEDITDQQKLEFYLKLTGSAHLNAKIDYFVYKPSDWPQLPCRNL